jgi:hypothetical protein
MINNRRNDAPLLTTRSITPLAGSFNPGSRYGAPRPSTQQPLSTSPRYTPFTNANSPPFSSTTSPNQQTTPNQPIDTEEDYFGQQQQQRKTTSFAPLPSMMGQQQQHQFKPLAQYHNEEDDDRPPTDTLAVSTATLSLNDSSLLLPSTKTPISGVKSAQIFSTPEEVNSTRTASPSRRRKSEHATVSASILQSPTHIDPFYDQPNMNTTGGLGAQDYVPGESEWVTIFGFPPSKAFYILNQFSQYGKIVDHKIGSGNWMHVRYDSKFHAQKALSKNGKVFDSVLMIGVVECLDPDVLKAPKKNYRLVRRPHDESYTRSTLAPFSQITGQKRTFEAIDSIPSNDERELKRPRPQPEKGILSKIAENLFRF